MVYVVSTNYVKASDHEEFLKLTKEMVDLTRLEEGCVEYTLTKNSSDPDMLVYIEIWETKQHLEAHKQSEHFKRIVPQAGKFRFKPNDLLVLDDAHTNF